MFEKKKKLSFIRGSYANDHTDPTPPPAMGFLSKFSTVGLELQVGP